MVGLRIEIEPVRTPVDTTPASPPERPFATAHSLRTGLGFLLGGALVVAPAYLPPLREAGWQAIGPLLGITCIVFSLFGELPRWIAWTQRLGAWLSLGIAIGTLVLLVPLVLPAGSRQSSFDAWSPRVWMAYASIVLVSIAFEQSSIPYHIYAFCQRLHVGPAVLIPLYVLIAGLLGNVLDGVSIIAISVVIFLHLLPLPWALRASFALLFGGLISNLITVAAEPTNIKFQDVLAPLLDRVAPAYWVTNWPISVLGIVVPAFWLWVRMRAEQVPWATRTVESESLFDADVPAKSKTAGHSLVAMLLLATGIVLHSVLQARSAGDAQTAEPLPLGVYLLPAGLVAARYLWLTRLQVSDSERLKIQVRIWKKRWERRRPLPVNLTHILYEVPVWGKLMIIFSLLWFLSNALPAGANVFAAFFTWPSSVRYGAMVVLSLASSVTDNVALAAMQGSLLLAHPLTVWQIRLLFILLTWAGGFTPFGCLQSLALNSRVRLSTVRWFREGLLWGGLALVGGLAGLALIAVLYPTAVGVVR